MASHDFIELAKDCFLPDGNIDPQKEDQLWQAAFSLTYWFFLMTERSQKSDMPVAQMIQDKIWFLAFTDEEKLMQYAEKNNNLAPTGEAFVKLMTPQETIMLAFNHLETNVDGIRFNEGQSNGWFVTLEHLTHLPDYTKTE